MVDGVLEALRANNRINLMLFDAIDDEGMACTLSKRGGRSVLRQFAHMHDVRRMHFDARGKKLGLVMARFPAKEPIGRAAVRDALLASQEGLETFFAAMDSGEARCFRKGPVVYAGYFLSHDAHHRGNILLTLKTCGHAVDKDVRYALWGAFDR